MKKVSSVIMRQMRKCNTRRVKMLFSQNFKSRLWPQVTLCGSSNGFSNMGLIIFATLLSSPCYTLPPPPRKGGGRNFLGSINGHIFSGLSSSSGSHVECGKELLIAFPLINNARCVIKSIVLHLKSLLRLSLQKELKWPEPVARYFLHNASALS